MTKTERAIAGMQYIFDDGQYPQCNDDIELAISVLRECAERREGCEYCETPGKTLYVVECTEPRIMLHVSGRYVQMYDEEYPGWVDNFPIHYCPMCGRKLERSDT